VGIRAWTSKSTPTVEPPPGAEPAQHTPSGAEAERRDPVAFGEPVDRLYPNVLFGTPRRSVVDTVLIWCERVALGFLASFALLRLVNWDGWAVTAVVGTYTLYLFLPAYPITVVAGVQGRWRPFGLALLLVLAHLAWVLPTLNDASESAFISDDPSMRIVSANVDADNPEPAQLLAQLLAERADLVTLVEYTPEWERVVDGSGFRERYPYAVEHPRDGEAGMAIFSRRPLVGATELEVAGTPLLRVRVALGDEPVTVFGFHAVRADVDFARHRAQHAALREQIGSDPHRVVIVGDFGATQYNRVMASLESHGVHSAHEEAGRGFATTYPNGKGNLLTNLLRRRLDHAYLSGDLATLRIDEGKGSGSDHRPVILEFTTRPDEGDS
jgi:endonuclease/exonuclease/phosphatase (EEP) superfamily protein YafD